MHEFNVIAATSAESRFAYSARYLRTAVRLRHTPYSATRRDASSSIVASVDHALRDEQRAD